MTLLLLAMPERAQVWSGVFAAVDEAIVVGEDAVQDPAAITHLACWMPPADMARYPNLRVVISVGAGVDQMPALPVGVQLVRTLAPGIEEMVRDWTVMATLMLHRDMPRYLAQSVKGEWAAHPPRLARDRRIGIMGMGHTGRLVAGSLATHGFPVAGWSRSGTPVQGIEMFGGDALEPFLARTDLLICLLPLTPQTRGLLSSNLFAHLPEGAALVHAGRGAQLDMAALRDALDQGRLTAAMLDVTDPEPLPADHWAWADPRVLVTPHVAAQTDPKEGVRHALAVIRADRAGLPLPGLVDPARGY
ncbi:MAG: 2-hydroxyacid dehydrogenase [Rhodobacterales bacterium]